MNDVMRSGLKEKKVGKDLKKSNRNIWKLLVRNHKNH